MLDLVHMGSQRFWQGLVFCRYPGSRCLLIFVFLALPLSATTYYVDCNGSDSNNGTSTSTPWKTIAKVNGSSFSPGNSVLFNKGCTWQETLIVPTSGSAGNPITFSAYGTGANPIFDGNGTIANGIIVNTSHDYITFDHITVQNGIGSTPNGMWNINTSNHVTIQNCELTNANAAVIIYGIAITGGSYNTVQYCKIHDIVNDAIYARTNTTHLTITHNEIYNVLQVDQNSDGAALMFGGGGTGWQDVNDATVTYNLIHDVGVSSASWGGTQTVVCDRCDRFTFMYNVIYNSSKGGVGIAGQTTRMINGGVIAYNIIYKAPNGVSRASPGRAASIQIVNTNNAYVYGNTVWAGVTTSRGGSWSDSAVLIDGDAVTMDGNHVENNIFGPFTGPYRKQISVGGSPTFTNLVIDYNIYYDPNGLVLTSPSFSTNNVAAWTAHNGYDAHSLGGSSTTGIDPKFTNAGGADFTLLSSSPAIDVGTKLGTTYQMGLDPRSSFPWSTLNQNSQGSGWEVGAFVFVRQISPAPPTSLSATVK